jgi:hypothetical protein
MSLSGFFRQKPGIKKVFPLLRKRAENAAFSDCISFFTAFLQRIPALTDIVCLKASSFFHNVPVISDS